MTDYKRMGGSAVGSSIRSNLRLFFHWSFRSHCPTVGPNSRDDISGNGILHLIVGPKSSMSDYCRSPPIIIFLEHEFSHWHDFSSNFPTDPPISRAMGRQLFIWCKPLSIYLIFNPRSALCWAFKCQSIFSNYRYCHLNTIFWINNQINSYKLYIFVKLTWLAFQTNKK